MGARVSSVETLGPDVCVCVCVCVRTHADQKLRSLKHCHWELFEDMLESEDFSLILSGSWDHFGSNSQFQVFLDPSACQVALVVACQAPLSVGFSRQEYWSGLLFPPPGDLPNPRTEPTSLALVGGFFTPSATWEALIHVRHTQLIISNLSVLALVPQ